jgi:hypothetical protein
MPEFTRFWTPAEWFVAAIIVLLGSFLVAEIATSGHYRRTLIIHEPGGDRVLEDVFPIESEGCVTVYMAGGHYHSCYPYEIHYLEAP